MKLDSTMRFVLLKCKIRSTKFDIRISDFDLLFGNARTFARLCKEILGHNTSFSK